MKPVILPIVSSSGGDLLLVFRSPEFFHGAAVFIGHDFYERFARAVPVAQDVARAETARIAVVVLDEAAQYAFVRLALGAARGTVPERLLVGLDLFGVALHPLKLDHGRIAIAPEAALRVPHIGDAARHAGREIAPGGAQHHHGAARHVFAAVVAGALDDRRSARVAHRKAFAGHAAEEGLAAQRAVQHRVADDDVLGPVAAEVVGRAHDDAAAGQALADVVVAFADQVERDA